MTEPQTFNPPGPLNTAVLFLVFNRPDVTAQVFEAIRQAKPPRLYVAADGPRPNRPGEAERCAEVRRIATNVDWPCEVKTLFRESNLGCKRAVSDAITWFFENEPQGIILEDDCLPDPTFFRYCEDMLTRYQYDDRVMMVSGTNLAWDIDQKESHYFSRYPHIWGWASWRRVWTWYDVHMMDLQTLLSDSGFVESFRRYAEYEHWSRVLTSVRDGQVDTWDAQVVYLAFSRSQMTVYPSGNLISNIGFGADATHTLKANSWLANLPLKPFDWSSGEPKFAIPNAKAESVRKMKEGIGINRYIRYLRYLLDGVKRNERHI